MTCLDDGFCMPSLYGALDQSLRFLFDLTASEYHLSVMAIK